MANNASFLSVFDFTSLPATLVTNLVVAISKRLQSRNLLRWSACTKTSRRLSTPALLNFRPPRRSPPLVRLHRLYPSHLLYPLAPVHRYSPLNMVVYQLCRYKFLRWSPLSKRSVDPVKMHIDEEELEYEPEKPNEEVCINA